MSNTPETDDSTFINHEEAHLFAEMKRKESNLARCYLELELRISACQAKLAEAEWERDYQASECALLRKYRVDAEKGWP